MDTQQRVIISSDEGRTAAGRAAGGGELGKVAVTVFGGREYPSVTCSTQRLQGWRMGRAGAGPWCPHDGLGWAGMKAVASRD